MGWQDWGWRRWRRCWRRPSRRKPDWWRVELVPLIFNCLWNIIYPSPCLSYKRDIFHEFKKEAPGPFGIAALKIVSYLQRVIDMKGWILTSSPTVILTQTISCWIIFSCIPSHPAPHCVFYVFVCIFFPYCLLNLLTVDLKPLCVLICLSFFCVCVRRGKSRHESSCWRLREGGERRWRGGCRMRLRTDRDLWRKRSSWERNSVPRSVRLANTSMNCSQIAAQSFIRQT